MLAARCKGCLVCGANCSINWFDSLLQLLPVIIFQINGTMDRNNICININPERTNGHELSFPGHPNNAFWLHLPWEDFSSHLSFVLSLSLPPFYLFIHLFTVSCLHKTSLCSWTIERWHGAGMARGGSDVFMEQDQLKFKVLLLGTWR